MCECYTQSLRGADETADHFQSYHFDTNERANYDCADCYTNNLAHYASTNEEPLCHDCFLSFGEQ